MDLEAPEPTSTHLRSVPGPWRNLAVIATLNVCFGVGTSGRKEQELALGQTQFDPLDPQGRYHFHICLQVTGKGWTQTSSSTFQ